MLVRLDGKEIATLTSGKNIEVRVSPGKHQLECSMMTSAAMSGGATFDVRVDVGDHVGIVVDPGTFTGKPRFKVVPR